jgi:4'-phosphopantetheinyl transferase
LSLDENPPRGKFAEGAAANLSALPAPALGIALWWCALDASTSRLRQCEAYLSGAERARASRFGTDGLRSRYVVGRGTLRMVLGRTLDVAPADVPIVRGDRGRPRLAGDPTLDFNVSHTAGIALIGIAHSVRLGVDIERCDRRINVEGIARKFMSAAERAMLATLTPEAARRQLLRLWTCKEAMSKATGDALSAPFAKLDVDLADGPRLRSGPVPYSPAHWSLHAAALSQEFIATIAVWDRASR